MSATCERRGAGFQPCEGGRVWFAIGQHADDERADQLVGKTGRGDLPRQFVRGDGRKRVDVHVGRHQHPLGGAHHGAHGRGERSVSGSDAAHGPQTGQGFVAPRMDQSHDMFL
jgi:hypothetical protein